MKVGLSIAFLLFCAISFGQKTTIKVDAQQESSSFCKLSFSNEYFDGDTIFGAEFNKKLQLICLDTTLVIDGFATEFSRRNGRHTVTFINSGNKFDAKTVKELRKFNNSGKWRKRPIKIYLTETGLTEEEIERYFTMYIYLQ